MKWGNDPLRNEKYLILDAIIKFNLYFIKRDASKISIKEIYDFIDCFIKGDGSPLDKEGTETWEK